MSLFEKATIILKKLILAAINSQLVENGMKMCLFGKKGKIKTNIHFLYPALHKLNVLFSFYLS